ncbi:MAG: sulfatase-like hydrolase/transferase, partial [Pseudomonadota bacterium]|nr:sulfatase-like hydrolase/transferase [Pseudomonadota bacterium]
PTDRPFFLWVATLAPHEDLCPTCDDEPTPAPRHEGAFGDWVPSEIPLSFNEDDVSDKPDYIRTLDKLTKADGVALLRKERKRLESLLAVDDLVARVVNAVAARGELDNTVFLFTSDNGYALGEHRNDVYFKKVPYEESIRVPLYVRGPGFPAGGAETRLVSNHDLAGAVAALAGASPGLVLDGGDIQTVSSDRAVYLYNSGQKGPPAYDGVRTSRWVYLNYETGEKELYDLQADPFQLESRHADPAYADVQTALHDALKALRLCAGPTCDVTVAP